MIEFEIKEKKDISHMILAFILGLVVLLLGMNMLEHGIAFQGKGFFDWLAFVSVALCALASVVLSAYYQFRSNGSQKKHFLPFSCVLFGLLLFDFGKVTTVPTSMVEVLAVMLCAFGCCLSVCCKRNSLIFYIQIALTALVVASKGYDGLLLLKVGALVFFLLCTSLRYFDSSNMKVTAFAVVFALFLGLTFFVNCSLYVWASLALCIYAWVLFRYGDEEVKEVKQEKKIVEVKKSEDKPITTAVNPVAEKKSEVLRPLVFDTSIVKPEVSSWMQGFVNAAFIVEVEGSILYAYDASTKKYYRYSRQANGLVECSGGIKPDFESLVEKMDRPMYAGFLSKAVQGIFDDDFHCRLWDEERLCYFDYSVRAKFIDSSIPVLAIYAIEIDRFTSNLRSEVSSLETGLEESKHRYAEVIEESKRVFYACNELLNSFIEKKSEESYSHNHVVCSFAEILMRKAQVMFPQFGIDEEMIMRIKDATILHDVGKIMVPDNILKKQGRFTPEEAEIMRLHSRYGAEIINMMPYVRGEEQTMKYALDIALHHHERVDGNGYPSQLKGDQIPFYVQMVALADVYEALTARRVYKGPVSHEKALEMIRAGECGIFSDWIMELLEAVKDDFSMVRSELNY